MVNNLIQKKYYDFIKLSLQERKEKSNKINNKHKDKVIIATLFDNNIKLNDDFNTFIFIVNKELIVSQLIVKIRSKCNINENEAIYLSFDDIMINNSMTLDLIQHQYQKEDGFVYMKITKENTFG